MSLQVPSSAPIPFQDPDVGLKRNLRRALIIVFVLVFGLGGLAAVIPMAGAVVAHGDVSVASKVKKVQHPTGGVISEILVKDGDTVKAGQILIRLDNTVTGSNVQLTGESVDQLLARDARLEAERDSRAAINFPPELLIKANDPVVKDLLEQERRLFQLRRSAQTGQQAQLRERVAQLDQQILGYQVQAQANRDQSKLIQTERANARELYEKRLVTIQRFNELERSAVELEANAAALDTSIAQARARITETREQMIAVDQDVRSRAGSELADVESKLSEMRQHKVTADDSYERGLIRAPQDGKVDKLAFNTIGGVIGPGQTILEVVPQTDELTVVAMIKPTDIDQVRAAQQASLRFSAFNMRTTPELKGNVLRVSADRTVDERTGAAFYTAIITIPPTELKKLGELKLVPGMPVETFIETGNRTMLSYLVKPLADQLQRSFRDQ